MIIITDSDEFSEDEPEPEFEDLSYEEQEKIHNEVYPIEKRKEIVDWWWRNGNPRPFSSVQARYRKLKSESTLRTWKYRFDHGIGINLNKLFASVYFMMVDAFSKQSF